MNFGQLSRPPVPLGHPHGARRAKANGLAGPITPDGQRKWVAIAKYPYISRIIFIKTKPTLWRLQNDCKHWTCSGG